MRGIAVWMLLGALMLLHAAVGEITLAVGEVRIVRDTQTFSASTGMALLEKDVLSTGESAQVQMRFKDDTIVSLGKNASFSIDAYLNDAVAPQAKFGIAQGTFGVITGKIGKVAPQNFSIQTRTATIGIRGTHIRGRTGSGGDMIACLRGKIRVTSLGTGASEDVPAGSFTRVPPGQDPTSPEGITPQSMDEMGDSVADDGADGDREGAPLGEQSPPPPPPLSSPPPLAQDTLDRQKEQEVLEKLLGGSACGAGFVGTSPNCQPISTTYAQPAYWTAPLAAHAPAPVNPVTLLGFATSQSGVMLKHDGTFELNMLGFEVDDDSRIDIDSGIVWLEKAEDQQTMSYFSLNRFSILGVDGHDMWLQSENTQTNEYVSWGYWQIDAHMNPRPVLNFWVAGVNPTDAATYIDTKIAGTPVSYVYEGKSIGYVYNNVTDAYTGIDAVTNNTVLLAFDFGGGNSSLQGQSYIQFQTNGSTPEVWRFDGLTLDDVTGGVFTATGEIKINNAVVDDGISSISGKFYGTDAQALGGTFQAPAGDKTAIGVFKAVR
ncbi:MAG: FecR domain-containing protein [Campylobacterales bacterium]|nr:FecR domain-containing protein [Campylobacterales bacterium]